MNTEEMSKTFNSGSSLDFKEVEKTSFGYIFGSWETKWNLTKSELNKRKTLEKILQNRPHCLIDRWSVSV